LSSSIHHLEDVWDKLGKIPCSFPSGKIPCSPPSLFKMWSGYYLHANAEGKLNVRMSEKSYEKCQSFRRVKSISP
jgi:hypothetical protein